MKKIIIILMIFAVSAAGFAEGSIINNEESPVQFFLESELGTVSILYHTILIGSEAAGPEPLLIM